MKSVWELKNLTKQYRDPTGARNWVLNGVNFRVDAGERVGIIGRTGCGKSTLAEVGLGLRHKDGGTISLFGEDTKSWSPSRWRLTRRRMQYLYQDPAATLDPNLSIENFLVASSLLHQPRVDSNAAAQRALQSVGLAGRGQARPHHLSGGERRRVGIARLLVSQPELLVVDELTTGLDATKKHEVVSLLFSSVPPKCSIVLISHDLHLLHQVVSRVFVMSTGQVVDSYVPASYDSLDSPHNETCAILDAAFGRGAQ